MQVFFENPPGAKATGDYSTRSLRIAPCLAAVEAVVTVIEETPRNSSLVENLNSRLRCYFFLRRQLGQGYLDLLRVFLNHRTFVRSEHPERVGKSPTELMTGKSHPHWLKLLGFERFRCYPKLAVFEPCLIFSIVHCTARLNHIFLHPK